MEFAQAVLATVKNDLPTKLEPGIASVETGVNKRARERNAAAVYCYRMCCTIHTMQ
jgi:hypothetical protein